MHKLILIIFLIASVSTLSRAQNSNWSAGMSIMPEYSFPETKDDLVEAEDQFGFTIQAVVSYAFNPRIEILSGLVYEFNRIEMVDYSPLFNSDINEGIPDFKKSWLENRAKVHYLGIPLHAKYNFSPEGNSGYLRLGYNQLFKVGGGNTADLHQSGITVTKTERELSELSGEIEMGIGFEIGSMGNSTLLLEAVGGYAVTGAFKEHAIYKNIRMWDLGVRIGVLFNKK